MDAQLHPQLPQLHVADSGGDGRPVVLVHGWPLSGESWAEQLMPLRDAGYRVVLYDRRGFGQSETGDGYHYDRLAADLARVVTDLELTDATLVGFSMGGGEVARYVATYGEERVHSVVFAAAVTPYLAKRSDNPDGPLDEETAAEMRRGLESDREGFFEGFVRTFFSAGGELKVGEDKRQEALTQCLQSDQDAALACLESFATTDFRSDLEAVTVPALVIHGDADATVPFEGSGARTHAMIPHSELHVVAGGPHGINASHRGEFNRVLLEFLEH
jgi:non-heme chloroperoxidase